MEINNSTVTIRQPPSSTASVVCSPPSYRTQRMCKFSMSVTLPRTGVLPLLLLPVFAICPDCATGVMAPTSGVLGIKISR